MRFLSTDAAQPGEPEISVIVPTRDRPKDLARLLLGLSRQTLAPSRFEAVLCDDGSEPPVSSWLARRRTAFPAGLARLEGRGPAAARNRALAAARAPIVLFLNDDAAPPPDLLERHLAAQRSSDRRHAWLGGFEFAPDCDTPLARALIGLGVLFPYRRLRPGRGHGGEFFWTCNLSVARAAVEAAGGFDESFSDPVCEDVELGHRLARRGVEVRLLDGAPCLHHHRIDAAWLRRRQVLLGIHVVRMWRKHGDPAQFPWIRQAGGEAQLVALLEQEMEVRGRAWRDPFAALEALDREAGAASGRPEPAVERMKPLAQRVNDDAFRLGLLAGLRGWSREEAERRIAGTAAGVASELARFTGQPEAIVRSRMRGRTQATAASFESRSGSEAEWYRDTDAYLYELANWEDDPLRDQLAAGLARNPAAQRRPVLDFGCGIGSLAIALAERGVRVVACDVNRHNSGFARYRARERGLDRLLEVVEPFAALDRIGAFGAVSCLHVLEHVADPGAVLDSFFDCLADGGLFLGVAPFDLIGPEFPEHRPELAHLRLETLIEEHGFERADVLPFGSIGAHPFRLVAARKVAGSRARRPFAESCP